MPDSFPDAPADGLYLFSILASLDGQTILFTRVYRASQGLTTATIDEVINDLLTQNLSDPGNVLNNYLNCLSSDVFVSQAYGQLIWPERYSRIYFTGGSLPATGTVDSPALPPGTQHAITYTQVLSARSNRGKNFIGGVPGSFSANGLLTTAGNLALAALANSINQTWIGTESNFTFGPVIYDKAAPGISPDIYSYVIQPQTRTFRRRVIGRGI